MSYKPKPIRTPEDYDAALAALRELWGLSPAPGSEAFDRLELIGMLIENYEMETAPVGPPDPIAAIEFYLEQHGLQAKDFGKVIGSAPRASEILKRKRGLSLNQIRRVHDIWRIPADCLIEKPVLASR